MKTLKSIWAEWFDDICGISLLLGIFMIMHRVTSSLIVLGTLKFSEIAWITCE